jgi:hypothetical protein
VDLQADRSFYWCCRWALHGAGLIGRFAAGIRAAALAVQGAEQVAGPHGGAVVQVAHQVAQHALFGSGQLVLIAPCTVGSGQQLHIVQHALALVLLTKAQLLFHGHGVEHAQGLVVALVPQQQAHLGVAGAAGAQLLPHSAQAVGVSMDAIGPVELQELIHSLCEQGVFARQFQLQVGAVGARFQAGHNGVQRIGG